jgi:predicted metal-dependent peptidase
VIDVSRWKKYLRTDKIKIAAYNIDKDNVVDNELNQTIGCALHHSSGDVRLAVANNIFRYLTVMNAKWLIAHEISHILLGHIYHKYKNGQKERPINEFQANAIASAIFYNNHDYAETMITESLWVDMVINAKHLAMDMKDDQDVLDYANNLIHKKCICYRSYVKHFEMFHIYVEYLEKKNIFPDLFETVSKKDGGE